MFVQASRDLDFSSSFFFTIPQPLIHMSRASMCLGVEVFPLRSELSALVTHRIGIPFCNPPHPQALYVSPAASALHFRFPRASNGLDSAAPAFFFLSHFIRLTFFPRLFACSSRLSSMPEKRGSPTIRCRSLALPGVVGHFPFLIQKSGHRNHFFWTDVRN